MSSDEPIICQDTGCLDRFFRKAGAKRVSDSVVATFESPWGMRVGAATKAAWLKVSLLEPTVGTLETEQRLLWVSPVVGFPIFERSCDAEEKKALLNTAPDYPGLWTLLAPVFVFAGFGSVLLILWLAVPRLIWGEPTIAELQRAQGLGRWSGDAQQARGQRRPEIAALKKPPLQTPQQSPIDATRVDLVQQTMTRSRLEKIRQAEDDVRR